jgi:ribosome-associated heat shock protein Hsp15
LQRIDKFLWYARFFKSRTLAAAVVSNGRVRINGERCEKPSAAVKLGDVLTFPAGPRVRVIKVLSAGERRGPATEARTLYQDLTPAPQAVSAEETLPAVRDKGTGRPTKKERRDIAAFTSDKLED